MSQPEALWRGFDQPVPPGGYAWWYLDALSDDGHYGLTVIAFIGSVFSPYYAWARRQGQGKADPLDHCALNVALYAGPQAPRHRAAQAWTMTERGRLAVVRHARQLQIGPSHLNWDGQALTVHINEWSVPWARRVRGTVRLLPEALMSHDHPLDARGLHLWRPLAPCARVQVRMAQPDLHWQGSGYLDHNRGERPLVDDFLRWDWSRAALAKGRSAVLYDAQRRDGTAHTLALAFDSNGGAAPFTPPPRAALPRTAWHLHPATHCDAGFEPTVAQGFEDGPFYARSLLHTHLLGEPAQAVHESLCLQRWSQPIVQMMLPFRMPRWG
jgi:carotenoid 1,2-hydratase